MGKFLIFILLFPFWLSGSPGPSAQVPSPEAVVHAVLFYSPTCGHCHHVITEVLPPLFEQYGEQLYIVGVDVTQSSGQALFRATLQYFKLESSGVPFLAIGDAYLIGSVDIPGKLPGLIEQYLAEGGVGWPAIPGLVEAMEAAEAAQTAQAPTPAPTLEAAPTDVTSTEVVSMPAATPTPAGMILTGDTNASPWARLVSDPAGNGLALVVLAGMLFSMVWGVILFRRSSGEWVQPWVWITPVLCVVGLGVAGYLAYVETAHVEAVCGPVGDCNTVQQSEYARLFGAIPIGILGIAGYVMILLAWGIARSAKRRLAVYASLAIFGMAAFGVLFSVYLTFLEPFVIGATCAWCLTSAILMTALFWLSLAPARAALSYLLNGEKIEL